MANILIPKRSSVPGKVPLVTDLQIGEIAVNLADRKIYSKTTAGAVVSLADQSAEIASLQDKIKRLEEINAAGGQIVII